MKGKDGKQQDAAPPAGAPQPAPPSAAAQQAAAPEAVRWGTRQMGPSAAPGAHPENQEAARWTAARGDQELPPYVIMGEPVAAPPPQQARHKGDSPMEHILDFFNTWNRKAEELASNIWLNLKTAPSMSDAAMGKLSLGAKALTEGGFDKLYKQTFSSAPEEQLKKTFACYLSGLLQRPPALLHRAVRPDRVELLQGYDPSGQGRDGGADDHEGEPAGEVRPHRHRGLARLLVHGLRQLRQGRAQPHRDGLPALPAWRWRRCCHCRQQVISHP